MGLRSPFLDRLTESVVIADGGMGTLLNERGISFEVNFDALCLDNPELVLSVHRDYIDAGAELIETNSFGANPFRLRPHGLEKKITLINRAAARVARQARDEMGKDVFISGAIGPTGRAMVVIDENLYKEIFEGYCRQVEGLLEGGVDLFIIETFTNINEIEIAIAAVRSLSHLPIIAQMTFTYDGITNHGVPAAEIGAQLAAFNVDVIGANCSVGPQPLIDVIRQYAQKTDKPLSVMPNAGLPRYVNGRYLYYASPEYFSTCGPEFVKYGVRLIGGCCGTTPEHIRKLSEVIKAGDTTCLETGYQPLVTSPLIDESVEAPATYRNSFREKLGKEFVVSVEIDPPRGSNPQKILKGAKYLASLGVDAVNVADSPIGRARMGALAAAALIRQSQGIEVILHLTCRDLNLMGLQSTVLGAYALGIQNILAITGDPPSGDYPSITAVYDVDSIGLLQIIDSLNRGLGITGARIGYPTNILVGAAVNPAAPDEKLEIERLRRKLDSGAGYFMTQPIYDVDTLVRFLDKTASLNLTLVMGVLPLMSLRHAVFLDNEVPGVVIPKKVMERIARAGDRAQEEGISLALEISERCREYVAGIYYMPSFGRYETIGTIIKHIGLTKP